jgi:hypothetical protein
MSEPTCVADPLSDTEARLLRAYVERDTAELAALAAEGAAMLSLTDRGFVERHEKGVLVTPEGLAAALT